MKALKTHIEIRKKKHVMWYNQPGLLFLLESLKTLQPLPLVQPISIWPFKVNKSNIEFIVRFMYLLFNICIHRFVILYYMQLLIAIVILSFSPSYFLYLSLYKYYVYYVRISIIQNPILEWPKKIHCFKNLKNNIS